MRVEAFGAGDERLEAALLVRRRVFMEEQGIPEELEIDDHDTSDPKAVHIVSFLEGSPIATGRFYDGGDGSVHIGRMAVLLPHRRTGAGSVVLKALLAEAERRGYEAARLDSQLPAIPFYSRHGFTSDGPRTWDAGILHQPMLLALGAARTR